MSVSKPTSSPFPRKPLQPIHNRQSHSKREPDDKKLKKKLARAELYKRDIEQGESLKDVRKDISNIRSQIKERSKEREVLKTQLEDRAKRYDAQLEEQKAQLNANRANLEEQRRQIAQLMAMMQARNSGTSESQPSKNS